MTSRISGFIQKDYPYTYARVSAKRAKLLDGNDYEKLLKMGPNEIARSLEDGDYSREIEELGGRYSGPELVELALNRNLANTMKKLLEIAPEPLKTVLRVYLKRYDVEAVKRIARARENDQRVSPEDLVNPVTIFNGEGIEDMMGMERAELVERLESGSAVNYSGLVGEESSIVELETGLDRAYAQELLSLKQYHESPQFTRFVESEVEHDNLMNALRLQKYGYAFEQVAEVMPPEISQVVEDVMRAEKLEDAVELVAREMELEAENLEQLERELEKRRLRNALQMMHAAPLGATSILGYVVAKTAEVDNLRTLIRGREAGMEPEEIREELVLP